MAKETELCFWAELTDRSGLSQAVSQEIQDQYSYKIKSEDGSQNSMIRVRATDVGGTITYEETLKNKTKTESALFANEETNQPITKEYFEAWIRCFDAPGCHKVRYTFVSQKVLLKNDEEEIELPEVKYEVDVFISKEGKYSNYCKVDIEIDNLLAYLAENHKDISKFDVSVSLSSLPIGLKNWFSAVTDNEEQRAGIDAFWKKFTYKDSERVK